MNYGQTIIDKAGKVCGSFYKLSQATGIPQQRFSEMRAGKRGLPLDIVPVIAEMAGVDVDEAIHQVMIEQTKDPERRGRLMEILGKAVAAGVAGMLVFSYSSDSISATRQIAKSNNSYDAIHRGISLRLIHKRHPAPSAPQFPEPLELAYKALASSPVLLPTRLRSE